MEPTAVLIKFKKDWADEFDVFGLRVMPISEWKELQEKLKEIKYPIEMYFGTNEELVFESAEETLQDLTVHELTSEEEAVLRKFIKPYESSTSCEFGWDPIGQLWDRCHGHYDE